MQLAIEAQYRNCDNAMTNLLDWLQDVERRLATQEVLKETVEELKRQTTTVKVCGEIWVFGGKVCRGRKSCLIGLLVFSF